MENENLSTDQLIKFALNEKDEDLSWDYIRILHKKGNQEVFEAAKDLCESNESEKVTLGADILGQLGFDFESNNFPFREQSLPILLKISETEKDIGALQSIVFALGRMNDEKATQRIFELKDHKHEDIRFAVVHGLLTIDEIDAIKAMIKLSADSDEAVRNWAAFGLGSQIEIDTEEIRNALFARVGEKGNEVCDEIRGEALVGLAVRKDERVIEPLLKELSSESVGKLSVEAASETGDARLCNSLLNLKDWWDVDTELLNEAIKNCCKNLQNVSS
ncbi:MAG: HEAT repeat domain-containing protein [Pyrinomonadaceae bacterium]